MGLGLSTVQNWTPATSAFWAYLIHQLALLDKTPRSSGREAQNPEFTSYKISALCLYFHAGCHPQVPYWVLSIIIIISCTYFRFGLEAGFQCLHRQKKGGCPRCCAVPGGVHLWAEEQRAEPKLEQLLLELSGCRQLVGLVNMCYFPMDQLSAAVMRRSDLFFFFSSLSIF